jgi:hypothetical protein
MVLGTSSGAGKSLMTAALCRVLRRRGEQPLPFKGQNMSLNAWVDGAGGEMAYSQALQAWASELVNPSRVSCGRVGYDLFEARNGTGNFCEFLERAKNGPNENSFWDCTNR